MVLDAIARSCVSAVLLLVVAVPALAQGVGSIGGTVSDASGGVLPGATITLTATSGGVGSGQTTTTTEQGAYQFTRLIPGIYVVKAALQGFRPAEQRNIEVNSDQVSRADIKLEIGTMQEGVTVSGEAPLLDTSTALKQTVISRDVLEALPNRTDVWSIARVIPGVVMSKVDVGGTEQFLQSAASVRGNSNENKFTIDGMDVSSLDGNASIATMYLDPYAFQETNFMMGAGSAEISNGGLTFNMVTRSGTNRLHGGAKYDGTFGALARARNFDTALRQQLIAGVPPLALAANPNIEPHADIEKMYDAGAWLAGPVVSDRLWFAGTWHDQRLDAYKLGSYNPDGTQVIDDNIMWTTTAKASWQMTRSAQLSYFFNLQYKLIGHRGGGTFADGRARNYNDKYPTVNQVKYTSTLGTKMVFDATYNRFRADDAFGSRPEVKPGDIATMDTITQVSGVALPTYRAIDMHRDQLRTSFSWFQGRHDVKVGYEYVNAARISRFWSTSALRANFASGVPTSVNTYVVQLTQSDTTYGADISELFRFRADEHGVFIQDRWTPTRRLVLNLGLRYETSSSFQPATCRPDTQFAPGACFDKITAPSFRDVSPRFNFVYDVTGDGRMALKFAANRYNQPINISLIERLNPVAVVNDQRSWTVCGAGQSSGCDLNGDRIPQLNELGPAPGYVFAGVNSRYADDLKRPISNEYTVEIQRQLPQNIVLSAGYTHKQTRRNIGETDTIQTLASWGAPITVREVNSGETVDVWRRGTTQSALLLYNSEEMDTNYHGGDITLNKRMSHRWSLMGGASWGKVTAKTRGGTRSNPHIINYFDGETLATADRPWSYRLSGVYELPYGVSASGTWQYQAGAPEETTIIVSNQTINLPQGNTTLRVREFGDTRLPSVAGLDLSFRKTFRMGGRTVAPRIDIFNATNESTVLGRITQLGSTYGRISGIQRARLIKIGINVEF
ncbi:MAG TPA: TonB-dependent receptor [Vicinamibacterales bacterium]|nr:TonB-dependent receptor [Vicinamibacterales bacterium]